MDALLSMGASNLVLSAALALAAWIVHRRARRPWLAHLLCLLVLVELVTPPLVTAPLFTVGAAPAPTLELADAAVDGTLVAGASSSRAPLATATDADVVAWRTPTAALAWIWILGSALVLAIGVVRVVRFDRALRRSQRPADARLLGTARDLAARFGLARTPRVRVVAADVSPFVWWLGGRSVVVVPLALVERLDERALRLVLAHEFAHVRRRDHVVRWLEWAALVGFWWNPVLWFARRGLRANEELCCDALVVERLGTAPTTYARSLLDALELLARPALRPPLVASSMTSGGSLEKRLTMLVSNRTLAAPSRLARGLAALVAVVVLPLGIASAQAPDYDAVGARLMDAVDHGELTAEQAQAMFGALAEQHFADGLVARRAQAEQVDARVLDALTSEQKWELEKEHRYIAERVAAGALTKEQAQAHLAAVEARMRGRSAKDRSQLLREKKYAEAVAGMKARIAVGELEAADAKLKLEKLRLELLEGELHGIEVEALKHRLGELQRGVDAIDAKRTPRTKGADATDAELRALKELGYVEVLDEIGYVEVLEDLGYGAVDDGSVLRELGYLEDVTEEPVLEELEIEEAVLEDLGADERVIGEEPDVIEEVVEVTEELPVDAIVEEPVEFTEELPLDAVIESAAIERARKRFEADGHVPSSVIFEAF